MRPKSNEKFTVVYLDDEPDLCDIFKESLENDSVKVVTYTDADIFLANIDELKPDLVFLDYRLPGASGDEIALKINSGYKKALVTGDFSVNVKAHFAETFRKPVDYKEIEKFISRSLAKII